MTAAMWATGIGLLLVVSSLLGVGLFVLLGESTYRRGHRDGRLSTAEASDEDLATAYQFGVLAGQEQSELLHGWPVTRVNYRPPDHWQLVDREIQARMPARPVFED